MYINYAWGQLIHDKFKILWICRVDLWKTPTMFKKHEINFSNVLAYWDYAGISILKWSVMLYSTSIIYKAKRS